MKVIFPILIQRKIDALYNFIGENGKLIQEEWFKSLNIWDRKLFLAEKQASSWVLLNTETEVLSEIDTNMGNTI